jgi:acetyl-CoA carboxylase carboxyltransferase component
MREKVAELAQQREKLELSGGIKAIEKQHKQNKLTARERVVKLLDPGTFTELNLWAKPTLTSFAEVDSREVIGDGVITGYGEINGRTVYVYAHDFIAGLAATQAPVQNWKVSRTINTAVKMGVPYIGIVDSGGVRLHDAFGFDAGRGISFGADAWYAPAIASGIIPSITLLLGASYAGTAYSPMLADLFFMVRGESFMSLASPELLKEVTFRDVTREEIGAAVMHAEVSGSCDYLAESDEECLEKCRELLSFLPSNCQEKPPIVDSGDSPERKDEELLDIIPATPGEAYDMHQVIWHIVDDYHFLELKREYGLSIVTALARMGGRAVGIVANNPAKSSGAIDIAAAEKEARFIRFCDAFNVPLIFLVDTPGYLASSEQEQAGLLRHVAMATFAICEATVPKITLYIGKCPPEAVMAMSSREMGNEVVFAWPTAQLYPSETVYHTASTCLTIDDIIDPRDSRPLLIKALKMSEGKAEAERPAKKWGNIPL